MRALYVCMGCWAAYFPHSAHPLPPRCACGATIVPTGYGLELPGPTPAEVAAEGDQVARECEETLDSLETEVFERAVKEAQNEKR